MKRFTAEQARELMPNKFDEMIEQIHDHIRNVAVTGGSVVTVTFSSDFNVENLPFRVKNFLEEVEGYEVILTNGMKSIEFCINWRDDKKFW